MTEVRKVAHFLPMSLEMAVDVGAITEEEARARGWVPLRERPQPRIPLRRRARWALARVWRRRPRVHFGPCEDHHDCPECI